MVSEPNFDTTTFFTGSLLVIEMKNLQIIINRPVYFGLSILELIYAFWYDYVKRKFGEKAKLCYMDTDGFIVYITTEDIYKDIVEDLET